jgi:hypothetical protein
MDEIPLQFNDRCGKRNWTQLKRVCRASFSQCTLGMRLIVRLGELFSRSSFTKMNKLRKFVRRSYSLQIVRTYYLSFIVFRIDYTRYGELIIHINERFSELINPNFKSFIVRSERWCILYTV